MSSTGYEAITTAIGRYAVLDEIGRGGMGVVFRAYDPSLDRTVALKLLAPHLAHNPEFVARLRREAVSAARLRHPHIALLYEFGQDESAAFLAMEYLIGPSLRQLLEDGPLPFAQVVAVVKQVASALDHAHALGVVHRDVKPSNILLNQAGDAVLIDFGLAQTAEDSLLTSDGALLGTPHYMSPEQARGLPADARSDQYALAAVAYEMLTGTPPFSGRSAAIIHGHIYEPAFADELSRAFSPAIPRRRSRRWLLPLSVALAAFGLVAVMVWSVFFARPTASAPPTPRPSLSIPTRVAWAYDPGFAGGGELAITDDLLVFNTLDGALVALDPANGGVRWKRETPGLLFGAPSTGAGYVFVGDSTGKVLCLDPASGAVVWQRQLSGPVQDAPLRSNERLVVTTVDGAVHMLETGAGSEVWSRPGTARRHWPMVGAGSVFLIEERTLLALDVNSGAERWRMESASDLTAPPAMAGDVVLVGSARGVLYWVAAASGQVLHSYQATGPLSAAPLVDADVVYVADQGGRLTALQLDTAQPIWQFPLDTAVVAAPLLVDGKLFVGTTGGVMHTLDARSGRLLAQLALDSSIQAAPLFGGDYVYVRGRKLYALGA
jgi:outer membrane protein assembly factor BamB/predicted Ser/Thr protein kinase